jgi:hypothetical protein
MKIPQLSPTMKFGTFLMFPYPSTCQAEVISMPLVKIGCTVKKLLWSKFNYNSLVAPLQLNFEQFLCFHNLLVV